MKAAFGLLLLPIFVSCRGDAPPAETPRPGPAVSAPAPSSAAGHEHDAPHAVALVELGDEFAHLEFVLDRDAGRLTAYVLDDAAEGAIRLAASKLEVQVRPLRPSAPDFHLALTPVANPLTGERAGDTSVFTGAAPGLKSLAAFAARVKTITVKGVVFPQTEVRYPEGIEG